MTTYTKPVAAKLGAKPALKRAVNLEPIKMTPPVQVKRKKATQ